MFAFCSQLDGGVAAEPAGAVPVVLPRAALRAPRRPPGAPRGRHARAHARIAALRPHTARA